MSEVNGVALFSRLNWPKDTLGARPLLVIESHEPSVWKLEDIPEADPIAGLRKRGFGSQK